MSAVSIYAKGSVQYATLDDASAGEGLAIFLSQDATAVTRFHFTVKAETTQGSLVVGDFFSSPPNATVPTGALSRMVASAVCPGAKSWSVEISNAARAAGPAAQADEIALVTLVSSRCCAGAPGVRRVNERYIYKAGTAAMSITAPGQTVQAWNAIGVGAGTVSIGGGNTITVPVGLSVRGEPGHKFLNAQTFSFVNVAWFIELLESA